MPNLTLNIRVFCFQEQQNLEAEGRKKSASCTNDRGVDGNTKPARRDDFPEIIVRSIQGS